MGPTISRDREREREMSSVDYLTPFVLTLTVVIEKDQRLSEADFVAHVTTFQHMKRGPESLKGNAGDRPNL